MISKKKKLRAKPISDQSNFQMRPQCERDLITTVEPENMKSPFDPRSSLRSERSREAWAFLTRWLVSSVY